MFGVGLSSAVPASYPKIIGPFEASRKANADGGSRRTYNQVVDQYVDSPSSGLAVWAVGGPMAALISAGYTLKFQVEGTRLEGPSIGFDILRLRIAGIPQGVQATAPVGAAPAGHSGDDQWSGYVAPSGGQTVSGAITWGNYYTADAPNTSHTGDLVLQYRYERN